jgi:hypothetical protein
MELKINLLGLGRVIFPLGFLFGSFYVLEYENWDRKKD